MTTINNPQKIHPPAYLSVEEVQVQDQTVLHVYVPESSQVHRCNGRIYDRNEDGDLDITDHTRLVSELYARKQATYSENKVYPYAGLEDLRPDLIDKCRRLAGVWRDGHPWLDMDDMELIKSAQLYQTDPETGKSGLNLAGILLLGKDQFILSAVPHHRTDLILRKFNLDRYDDRDLVRTNLISVKSSPKSACHFPTTTTDRNCISPSVIARSGSCEYTEIRLTGQSSGKLHCLLWIPAGAGMTEKKRKCPWRAHILPISKSCLLSPY